MRGPSEWIRRCRSIERRYLSGGVLVFFALVLSWILRQPSIDTTESGLDRLRPFCALRCLPFAVIVRASSHQGATLRTTGMVIDFPGLANSMTLISPT